MTTFDFSPLYRTTVGFDRIAELLDAATKGGSNGQPNYPPYNIEMEDENHYVITVAVAGFHQEELAIETENGVLTVSGKKQNPVADAAKGGSQNSATGNVSSGNVSSVNPSSGNRADKRKTKQYLHQGIAFRNFQRKFQLAEYVEVSGASLEHGLLTLFLERKIPEAMKQKKISIGSTNAVPEREVVA